MNIKSSFASKINWTQAIALVSMGAATFGLDLDQATLTKVLEGIIAANAIATVVMRTFFTTKLTAASVR